jgi:hypothetical protein
VWTIFHLEEEGMIWIAYLGCAEPTEQLSPTEEACILHYDTACQCGKDNTDWTCDLTDEKVAAICNDESGAFRDWNLDQWDCLTSALEESCWWGTDTLWCEQECYLGTIGSAC